MGSPTIFSGRYTKLLTQKGLLQQGGAVNQYDGLRNYIKNSSFESNTDEGWNRVKTTITGNLPTGTPTIGKVIAVAPSISSFGPFSGSAPFDTYALRFGNIISTVVAGEGVISDAFTVDPGDRGKVLTFKLYYQSDAGASTDNWSGVLGSQTWAVYIYDQTAGAWLQPTGFLGMNQNSGVGVVSGTFQSSVVAGQQYRIAVIALRNTTATSALQIDDVYVGPQTAPIGPVVTDWVSYTPTLSWVSGIGSVMGRYRRVGDNAEIYVQIPITGAVTVGELSISLPSPFTFDTNKVAFQNTAPLGEWSAIRQTVGYYNGAVTLNSSNTVKLQINNSSAFVNNTTPATWGNTDSIGVHFYAPIQGWSSSVQMSSDTDTRVVAASIYGVGATVPVGIVNFQTITADTHGAYSAGVYRFPVSGLYRISVNGFKTSGIASDCYLRINGVDVSLMTTASTGGTQGTGTIVTKQNAGDTVAIYNNTATWTPASTNWPWLSIERLSGPSVIAASETVACHVETAAGPTITTGSGSAVSFPTKVYDTHNAFSGTTYTVPVSGKYRITALLTMVNTSGTSVMFSDVYVNGALSKNLTAIYPYLSNLNNHRINGSVTLNLNAGQTVQLFAGSGTAIALFPSAAYNYFIIERVGN